MDRNQNTRRSECAAVRAAEEARRRAETALFNEKLEAILASSTIKGTLIDLAVVALVLAGVYVLFAR